MTARPPFDENTDNSSGIMTRPMAIGLSPGIPAAKALFWPPEGVVMPTRFQHFGWTCSATLWYYLSQFLPVIGAIVADLVEDRLEPSIVAKFSIDRIPTGPDPSRKGQPRELNLAELCSDADLSLVSG